MPISETYNMDCMEYMKSIPDKFFDLAVVDPPYGINAHKITIKTNMNRKHGDYNGEIVAKRLKKGRLNKVSNKFKDRALSRIDSTGYLTPPTKEYFQELMRVSRNQIIWGGNYFQLPPTRCIVCCDNMQPWDNFSQVEIAWTSFDRPASLFRLSNTYCANKEAKIHPTQKPVSLYEWIMKNFAKSNDKILDTHLGSGSSRIAAYKLGLDFYGTEIDKAYFDAEENRFREICLREIKREEQKFIQRAFFELR